jgi:hypothetical protein
VGDCAKLSLNRERGVYVRVGRVRKDRTWRRYRDGDEIEVPIYSISYSDEKENCRCNPCWQHLKRAIRLRDEFAVNWTQITNNAKGGPSTYINPQLDIRLPDLENRLRKTKPPTHLTPPDASAA